MKIEIDLTEEQMRQIAEAFKYQQIKEQEQARQYTKIVRDNPKSEEEYQKFLEEYEKKKKEVEEKLRRDWEETQVAWLWGKEGVKKLREMRDDEQRDT